jgi:NAD(P)-dependent dehydrogenase (short-subunit alcohol dehydrogenase family)
MDVKGTVALVTGGASGLGAATARRLFDAGASVVLVDLPSSDGAAYAAELNAGSAGTGTGTGTGPAAATATATGTGAGPRAVFAAADVTNEADVQAAVDTAVALGPLRIVVNCAGVATPGKVLGRDGVLPLDVFSRVIQVNLIGTFNVLRLAAAAMVATEPVSTDLGGPERGVIVNTASVAAFDGQIGQPAYAASKGAVAAMTLPLARELARSLVRVVTIAPGIFETPMMATLPQDAQDSLGRQVPHPSRLGKPAEYASLVAHIVENAMLNGETIRLDGAIRMGPK